MTRWNMIYIYIWSLKLYACYHKNHDCGHGYQIPQTSITLIFETTSSNAEQKVTFARYQTFYISSTEGAIHGRTSVEASGRTNSLMQYSCTTSKIINIGYRQDTISTLQKQYQQATYLFSSRNAEQKMTLAHYQTCYTSSTEDAIA